MTTVWILPSEFFIFNIASIMSDTVAAVNAKRLLLIGRNQCQNNLETRKKLVRSIILQLGRVPLVWRRFEFCTRNSLFSILPALCQTLYIIFNFFTLAITDLQPRLRHSIISFSIFPEPVGWVQWFSDNIIICFIRRRRSAPPLLTKGGFSLCHSLTDLWRIPWHR